MNRHALYMSEGPSCVLVRRHELLVEHVFVWDPQFLALETFHEFYYLGFAGKRRRFRSCGF